MIPEKRCTTEVADVILMECLEFLVTMHQEIKDDISLEASQINLPSENNSLTLLTIKSWTSLNTLERPCHKEHICQVLKPYLSGQTSYGQC